jgi:ADP-ribose pyrophosphatase YjhB (NUDIX family)
MRVNRMRRAAGVVILECMARPICPPIAADVIIEIDGRIVLIERRNYPHGWAIPGGFVDVGETVEAAARREMREETGLEVELTELLGVYSRADRDPRGHTVSLVYVGRAQGEPHADDDAKAAALFSLDALPAPLAFDHTEILADYRRYKQTGKRPEPWAKTA